MSFPNYHPVFLKLTGKKILIVGAGNVALEKLGTLLDSGAEIGVVAPAVHPEIQDLADRGRIGLTVKHFEEEDLDGAFMVVATTDDPQVNARVFQEGDRRSLLSNSADDPINCNFIMAAIAKRGPMQAAISSAGCSPALAQRIRSRIADEMLTEETAALGEFLGDRRQLVKSRINGFKRRQAFWEFVLDSKLPKILAREGVETADIEFESLICHFLSAGGLAKPGKVALVGAGPGDPDLLTLKAARLLKKAEVVLYDRLVNPEILKMSRKSALLLDVGKAPGECGRPRQETINALLIEHARAGRFVVRLKGGDPFVFGRGGEEVLALREAGVDYEVVPGISSSIAAPGAAEIPVTHRSMATGFAVFTAQGAAQDVDTIPWGSLKEMPTIVLLMGVSELPRIVSRLREAGHDAETPIAVISHATLETEQIAVGTFLNIEDLARDLPTPATIVIGEVAKLARVNPGFSAELVAASFSA